MVNPTGSGTRLLPGTITTNEPGVFHPAHVIGEAPSVPADIFRILDYDKQALTGTNCVYGMIHALNSGRYIPCVVQYDKAKLDLSEFYFPGGVTFEFIEKDDRWLCCIRAQSILASCYVVVKKNGGVEPDES